MEQSIHSLSAASNSIFSIHAFSSQRIFIRVLFLIALTIVTCSINAPPTNAATFIVTTNADPDNTAGSCATNGTCSLRQAVNAANAAAGDDTINFGAGLANQIITLTAALNDIDITSNVVIDAAGVSGIQVSGANIIRVFLITSGTTVTLRGFTVRNGNSNGSSSFYGGGGGIRTENSFLTLENMVITNSFGDGIGGGGIFVANGGSLTITNSTISNNTGNNNGGGILLNSVPDLNVTNTIITNNTAANSEGGGISSSGSGIGGVNTQIVLTGVQLTNNHADNNPSGSGGGLVVQASNILTMTNCTVSGNTSFTRGGGVYINGSNGGTHRISGATFSGNTSNGNGGGLVAFGATLNIVNSTFSGNSALNGGGIYDGGSVNGEIITLRNVTVAGNTATTGQGGRHL